MNLFLPLVNKVQLNIAICKRLLALVYELSSTVYANACCTAKPCVQAQPLHTLSESPRIILDRDDEPEDWVHSAVSFYKSDKFIRNSPEYP